MKEEKEIYINLSTQKILNVHLFADTKNWENLWQMTSLTASHFSFFNYFSFFHSLNSQPHRRLKKNKNTAMQRSNDQSVEEECSICLDDLQKYGSNFSIATCCGKGMHHKCRDELLVSSMSFEQKRHCVMCRTKYPDSAEETVEQLRPWVEKGKAWAQNILGERYRDGEVLINPTNERKSCSNCLRIRVISRRSTLWVFSM